MPDAYVPLWEVDHPYYCSESSYYVGGVPRRFDAYTGYPRARIGGYDPDEHFQPFDHFEFDSWSAFDWKDSDHDMNLVFRWDWVMADPEDYGDGEPLPGDRLLLFVMLQRKGRFVVLDMPVQRSEEPEIRAWLAARMRTIVALWSPLMPDPESRAREER
jgi:hypothetical protein